MPVVVGVVALLIGIGIGGAAGTDSENTRQNAVSTAPAVHVTTTATVTVSSAASAAPAAPAVTTAPVPATPAAETSAAPPPVVFPMPDEVGKILQAAQDEMQAVSGDPFLITTSTDASGQGRKQVLDANWLVCSQSVPAGTPVDTAVLVDFGVVKIGESCP